VTARINLRGKAFDIARRSHELLQMGKGMF
jgi:hypothetical protein